MNDYNRNMNITNKVMNIDKLKASILMDIAHINNLLIDDNKAYSFDDLLSNIVVNTYLLSSQLDITPTNLDNKIKDKIRINVLDDMSTTKNEYIELAKHFEIKK